GFVGGEVWQRDGGLWRSGMVMWVMMFWCEMVVGSVARGDGVGVDKESVVMRRDDGVGGLLAGT
ncbi:hypothetical protein Tco_1476610, partial [Tanacetum coccineum]